jgi:hypothetical protein
MELERELSRCGYSVIKNKLLMYICVSLGVVSN